MVPITDIYQRVLVVLNKENRGYVTRDEFNSLAQQAQLEIFESYFTKHALAISGENDTTYSNPVENVSEKIHFFSTTSPALVDDTNNNGFFVYPDQFYRLGVVRVFGANGVPVIADEVAHNDITYINLSPLTAPTRTQPVFTRLTRIIDGVVTEGVQVYPIPLGADPSRGRPDDSYTIELDYLRRPSDPAFTGTVVGQQVLSGTSDVNFELHASEEIELTNKILAYMGVVTRDGEVTGFASQKEQQIQNSEQ